MNQTRLMKACLRTCKYQEHRYAREVKKIFTSNEDNIMYVCDIFIFTLEIVFSVADFRLSINLGNFEQQIYNELYFYSLTDSTELNIEMKVYASLIGSTELDAIRILCV
ncbi:hypothetical protein HHI36_021358 [Cryptolaemus montrouzieri]|uniref:Uncharacterized protein n=1 Tax=Cryptolaemus montrouzieri TaxID=559131 RepID=A0ABD2MWI0_9CUCU